jgi:hypothetical protein
MILSVFFGALVPPRGIGLSKKECCDLKKFI